jgi:hypothetical protein
MGCGMEGWVSQRPLTDTVPTTSPQPQAVHLLFPVSGPSGSSRLPALFCAFLVSMNIHGFV